VIGLLESLSCQHREHKELTIPHSLMYFLKTSEERLSRCSACSFSLNLRHEKSLISLFYWIMDCELFYIAFLLNHKSMHDLWTSNVHDDVLAHKEVPSITIDSSEDISQ
jgi:hypothetical protein